MDITQNEFVKLNLPPQQLRLKLAGSKYQVFDQLRHRYVILTPEEWVRQNFVSFLATSRNYPLALMANEISLIQNGIKRRCDSIVADKNGNTIAIIEYKAPSINITQKVFDQIVRYNMVMKAKFLIVSNGLMHFCCKIDYTDNSYSFLHDIPYYNELFL